MDPIKIKNKFKISEIYAAGIMQNEKPVDRLSGAYDCLEAVFVNSGTLTVAADEHIFECTAGGAVIFKPGEMHYLKLSYDNYTEYTVVSFKAEGELLEKIENTAFLPTVLQKQLILSIFNQIVKSGEYNKILPLVFKEDSFATLKLAATIELLIIDISFNAEIVPETESREALLFKKAVKEMKKNVLGQLSVNKLAEKLEISLSHLKRIFAAFTDVGVHEYFMGLKIVKAKEMLKSGVSVTETAELTGFNNQNYFSAAFKRISGISPKEYAGVKKKSEPQKSALSLKKSLSVPKERATADMPSYLL